MREKGRNIPLHSRAIRSNNLTAPNSCPISAANLATAALVTTASFHSLPVSTTHVSVGALLGIGILTKQAKWRSVGQIVMCWVITLPCAALLAMLMYWVIAWRN